ncbi:MAG TPA: DUF493 family protein [Flavobacteriaceae bacterium]|nr:DUF493 family protein [Flavobacteriaceae bacterium]
MDHINNNFYKNLNQLLESTSEWPCEYLFKFIVKSDKSKIKVIESIFDNIGAIIKKKQSRNNNFTSISINVIMENPTNVIEKYKEVSRKIDDVILL